MVDSSMATVFAKMENLNPGGSVKDRMAAHIVKRAEEQGLLKPGATLVESTSGNTGLGLALVAAVKGYRLICTLPDKMSQEKIDMLKAFGAEVIVTPTDVAHDSPESYTSVAKRIARETPNSFYTDQYYNMDNPQAHYLTTGPEIWEDTDGQIDYFVAGMGTGGTVSGVGKYLKEKAKESGREVRIVCPDPEGSIYQDAFYKRAIRTPRNYKVEGIGHDWMVGTLDFSVIDEVRQVNDRDAFLTARKLARSEGIFSGGSTGLLVHGALQLAKEVGPGKIIVVIICDSGDRYISRCFNDGWMKDMGFLDLDERLGTVGDILAVKGRHVDYANAEDSIGAVALRMSDLGISQMPVRSGDNATTMLVHEMDLLQSLVSGKCKSSDPVVHAAHELKGRVSLADPIAKLQHIFDQNNVAVVFENNQILGIISKIDMVKYLANRAS